jgi:hypothetical protein
VADGGMRVWHFNGVITTYGKRDCRNSWRYVSLAVNRGAIKRGFTVYGPVRLQKNIIWIEASDGPYNNFLVTDQSIYCHMTRSDMNYLLYYTFYLK